MVKVIKSIYFCRVPIIGWFLLLALGPGGMKVAPEAFSGLLYLDDYKAVTATALAAFLLAATCLACLNLILIHNGPSLLAHKHQKAFFLSVFATAHAAPFVLFCSLNRGPDLGWLVFDLGIVSGYALSAILIVVSRFLQLLFSKPGSPTLALILPPYQLTLASAAIGMAFPSFVSSINQAFHFAGKWLLAIPSPGFIARAFGKARVQSGHVYAACLAIVTMLFDIAWGTWGQFRIDPTVLPNWLREAMSLFKDSAFAPSIEHVPAVTWVLIPVSVAVWVLSGLTNLIDRYRIPLLLPLVLIVLMTDHSPESDHFYRTERPRLPASDSRPDASEWIRQRSGQPIILISAPGGGIQSAYWATAVLARLDREAHGKLIEHVAAITSVSGGSVGVFHLVAAKYDTDKAWKQSGTSSLEQVAWGLTVPDRWRIMVPWVRAAEVDRGWALEESLEENAGLVATAPGDPRPSVFLNDGKADITKPALIINATVMETGGPIVFTNSQFLPDSAELPGNGPLDYFKLYRQRRIRLVTAARLSASFPYVSPGARTLTDAPLRPDLHLIDGGYYDNYGIGNLMRWLNAATKGNSQEQRVLLVRLYGFPEDPVRVKASGWFDQLTVPVNGVLNARDRSQRIVGNSLLDLAIAAGGNVKISQVEIRYQNKSCPAPPLNWILTPAQKACVDEQMRPDNEALKAPVKAVLQFLGMAS
jgi:hypothetical protein